MCSRKLAFLFIFALFVSGKSLAQFQPINESRKVDVGDNPINWGEKSLGGKKNVRLQIIFNPLRSNKSNMEFIPNTATSVSFGALVWEKNFSNTSARALFQTPNHLQPSQFKPYPTIFMGMFKVPKGEEGDPVDVDNAWRAFDVIQVTNDPHSFVRITRTPREAAPSGISVNEETDPSKWSLGTIKRRDEPVSHPPETDQTTSNLYESVVTHMTALSKSKARTPAFCETKLNEGKAKPGKVDFFIEEISVLRNQPCGYTDKDGLAPSPECGNMTVITLHVKLDAVFKRTMYIPKWKEEDEARKEAKEEWNKFVDEILVPHEEEHNKFFIKYLNALRNIEKMEFKIEICNSIFDLGDIENIIKAELDVANHELVSNNNGLDTPKEYERIETTAKKLKQKLK